MVYTQILQHGATSGVTGSCRQLRMVPSESLLIDCGLFQGAEASPEGKAGLRYLATDFALDGIKALVATHVHIDHVDCIPYLLAAGFKGLIICSEPSAKLLPIVLEDAFKLGVSRDQKQVERYIKLIEQRIIALPYKHWFVLVDTLAFSIGRSQELLYEQEDIIHRKNTANRPPRSLVESVGERGNEDKQLLYDRFNLPIILDSPPPWPAVSPRSIGNLMNSGMTKHNHA